MPAKGSDNALMASELARVRGVGNRTLNRVLDLCERQDADLADFLNINDAQRVISAELYDRIATTLRKFAMLSNDVATDGEWGVVCRLDKHYPPRLTNSMGQTAPPVLFLRGNRDLLLRPSVGFCGSRKASDEGLSAAEDAAQQVAESGLVVVSGYASGVDQTAHSAALEVGGATIVVIPEGASSFRVRKHLEAKWDWDRVLVISEFPWDRKWSVGNATQRNRTICGLSNALILIEAKRVSGSIRAGYDALELGLPVFAAALAIDPELRAGNDELVAKGAKLLFRSSETGRAKVQQVITAAKEHASRKRTDPGKLF